MYVKFSNYVSQYAFSKALNRLLSLKTKHYFTVQPKRNPLHSLVNYYFYYINYTKNFNFMTLVGKLLDFLKVNIAFYFIYFIFLYFPIWFKFKSLRQINYSKSINQNWFYKFRVLKNLLNSYHSLLYLIIFLAYMNIVGQIFPLKAE